MKKTVSLLFKHSFIVRQMSPYKKTKRFGRKRFTRKRYHNSKLNYAYNKVRQIAKTYHPEVKKFDVGPYTAVSVGTAATVYTLTNIGQGDTITTRQGNKILVKYLAIQGYLQHNNSSTIGQYVKIYLILDKQQVGDTQPTGLQIFETNGVLSYLNAGNVGRFKILKTLPFLKPFVL